MVNTVHSSGRYFKGKALAVSLEIYTFFNQYNIFLSRVGD